MNMTSALELLGFMNVAPKVSFFIAQASAPASRRFHKLKFKCLGVPQVEWNTN